MFEYFPIAESALKKPRWRRQAVLPTLKATVAGWVEDKAMRLSAALALYTILSMAPLLVITIKIVGVVLKNKDYARDQITDQITDLLGWRIAQAIQPMIDSSKEPGGGLVATVISSAVLVFSATGVFVELQDSMNTVWGVKPKPNRGIWDFIHHRLLSLAMVFGTGFLLLVSMFVTTLTDHLSNFIAGDRKWFGVFLDIVVSFAVIAVLFAAIFKFLPDVKLMWKNVWLGAVITSGLFTAGKYALALYFRFGSPASAFGAAGSLAAVILWVYYSSFILFFGAEFTKVWSIYHVGDRVVPEEHAVRVTEDDRARQGIPSEKRINDALAGRPLDTPPKPALLPVMSASRDKVRLRAVAYAMCGLVVGTILGARWARGRKVT